MTVLMLAQERDTSTDRVVAALYARDVPVFRAELRWFPLQLDFAAVLADRRWIGVLTTPHDGVELSAIRSIWYRDPGTFEFPQRMTAAERAQASTEARLGLGGILATLDVPWMNEPDCAVSSEYPPLQLVTAATCGLTVPPTLITNTKLAVHFFSRASRLGVAQKPLGSDVVDDQPLIHYTWRTGGCDFDKLAGVELTAHRFQNSIDLDHRVRVIAVGDQLFPAALGAGSTAAGADAEAGYPSGRYEPAALPAAVEQGLRDYLTYFGLTYAAIDLAVDRDGRHVFLGSDSAGQHDRLETDTGAPITDAIADMLAAGVASATPADPDQSDGS